MRPQSYLHLKVFRATASDGEGRLRSDRAPKSEEWHSGVTLPTDSQVKAHTAEMKLICYIRLCILVY